jgi:1,4-dihydroxy-2-naphthoate octaprenyltransferase
LQTIKLFIRLSRPLFLLGGFLFFALGAGIAHYLGAAIEWNLYFLGQAWVTLMQLSIHYLNEYFDTTADADNPNRTLFSGGSGAIGEGKLPRPVALWSSLACLTVVASLTVIMMVRLGFDPLVFTILALGFFGGLFYSVPPFRLASSGYGELTTSFLVANLIPSLAFVLQTGDLHRLVAMATFPLTFQHMSMILAFELPDYGTDIRHLKRTLMVRVGWESGVILHNILLLAAYVILAISVFSGLPFPIAFPAFLTLPLALFQVWQMNRIASGGRPNWSLLGFVAVMIVGLSTYLVAFTFWTR